MTHVRDTAVKHWQCQQHARYAAMLMNGMLTGANMCLIQGILTDQALQLLVDSTWTSLDVSFSTISDDGLRIAMQSLPNLLALDLTGCRVHPKTLQLLSEHCPQLQVLRLGILLDFADTLCEPVLVLMQAYIISSCAGLTGFASEDVFATAIKRLMPRVTNSTSANDSWETLLPDSTAADKAEPSVSCLHNLTYLLWPSIPAKSAATLARKFPKVIVNPSSGSCPVAADPGIALDDPAIQAVAPFWQIDEEPEVTSVVCRQAFSSVSAALYCSTTASGPVLQAWTCAAGAYAATACCTTLRALQTSVCLTSRESCCQGRAKLSATAAA